MALKSDGCVYVCVQEVILSGTEIRCVCVCLCAGADTEWH